MLSRRRVLGSTLALPLLGAASMRGAGRPPLLVLDGVQDNLGEGRTQTAFADPAYLKANKFHAQVLNDFRFLQTAATFDAYDTRIAPPGSKERAWSENRAQEIDHYIMRCHGAGMAAYIWTDMLVLPKRVRELYGAEVVDEKGRYTFDKPRTLELHRAMLLEIGRRFPKLDGVVVRTGETYLLNTPYHEGNNPLTAGDGAATLDQARWAHTTLLQQLRETLCEAAGINVFYRTWAFGGIHTEPDVYLAVTDPVAPHPKLFLSIKHTKGDFHRKFAFNPTLGIGRHQQIVEVQCQREYEGKGSYPNYIVEPTINGFEENAGNAKPNGLADLKGNERFRGVWTWSRGGGWKGPYITNEFWCALNANVLARWANDPSTSERVHFDCYLADVYKIRRQGRNLLRRIALLSTRGVLLGRTSLIVEVNPFWIRDQYMGGITPPEVLTRLNDEAWGSLNKTFEDIIVSDKVEPVLAEKGEAARIWATIEALSQRVNAPDRSLQRFIEVSCTYGRIKHQIIDEGWTVMLLGLVADSGQKIDVARLRRSVSHYDFLWKYWHALARDNPECPTLYRPFAFNYPGPNYERADGMQESIDHYRQKYL